MTHPLVSIIMPVYNGADYLSQAIQGCLAQSCKNIELIIVDDCSTDKSLQVAESYAAADPRVKVLRHNQNKKLPAALNTGFAAAQGAFLTWTSHDNLYADYAIKKMLVFLENHPDVGVVYTDCYCIDEAGVVTGAISLATSDQLIYRNVVGASFLYRRVVQEQVGLYDENLFLSEDYDFWLRASQQFKFAHIAEELYYYRKHEKSLTNCRLEQVFAAVEETLEKFLRENKTLDRKTVLKIRYNLMLKSYDHQSYEKTIQYFQQCLKLAPLQTMLQLLTDLHDLRLLWTSHWRSS